MEEWKAIPGYEGFYSVSNLGRVRAEQRQVKAPRNSIRTLPQKMMTTINNRGYKQVGLRRDGLYKCRSIHSLVMLAFVGPKPNGMEVAHNNGAKDDNQLVNLRYDTPAGNSADRKIHGTEKIGKDHHSAKLNQSQVLCIRKDARKYREIAKDYGVDSTTIFDIKSRRSWAWL
jgi:hypothetical protein